MDQEMSRAIRTTRREFRNENEATVTKVENNISTNKITMEHRQEESIVVNQNQISGEIRTLKRRHVLHSPQIVITCPADDLPRNAICKDCCTGPTCCVDKVAEQAQKVTSDGQKNEVRSSDEFSNSDDGGEQDQLWCCDCGISISSNSSSASCSSDDGRETVISGNGFSRLAKFTSVDNLCSEFTTSNSTSDAISVKNCSSEEQSEGSVQNSEDSEYDEDDEEVIMVEINDELRNVVDNHIRSRKYSYASLSGTKNTESVVERDGLSKPTTTSKESEILQRFLEQVETHPQEEDLDVILEIVGEEEDEPCSRSRVNIRECTEKFKEIYAKKLKEIYHNKYRSEQIDQYNVHSKRENEKTEPFAKKNETECTHENKKTAEIKTKLKIEPGSDACISNSDKDEFTKTERTMIDKLPEIRQFHPNNIDHKIAFEDRGYLKATSLINEIESCFMETTYLVEKSIGSDRSSLYVLKNERDEENFKFDQIPSREHVSKNGHPVKTRTSGREQTHLDSSSYEVCGFHLPNSDRIVNEFQTLWGSKVNNKKINGDTLVVKSDAGESESLIATANVDRSENRRDEVESCNYFCGAKNGMTRNLSDTDRVPRTLEESIDIFEMILEERKKEHQKPYNSELSSSTLVLNSSRFLAAEKLKEHSVKFNSSDNILDDTDETVQSAWWAGRSSNTCASALVLKDCHSIDDEESISETPKYKSSYDLRFGDHSTDNLKQKSYKDSEIRSNRKSRSTYHKYDTYDSYTDDESYITTKRMNDLDECPSFNSKRIGNFHEKVSGTHLIESKSHKTLQSPSPIWKENEQKHQFETGEKIYTKTSKDRKENGDRADLHVKIAASRTEPFSKWKSEPDFGRFSYPLFGFQSSCNEEYFDRNYTTTALTTSVIKIAEETNQSMVKENTQPQKTMEFNSKENYSEDSSRAGTIQILSEQLLFSQVDELLKDLLENHVDSSTSDYDEGVVSDQSDLSDQNEETRSNNGCYSASQILSAIDGTDGDTELENNIIQIVRGINSISEKHLGRRIEEELEKFMKPKFETLCNDFDSNINSAVRIVETNNEKAKCRINYVQLNESTNCKNNINEEIKRISALPEISDIMSSIKHDPPKSNGKSTLVHELTAMEQISQASNELRSLGLHGLRSSQNNSNLSKFSSDLTSCARYSRKTMHEHRLQSRERRTPSTNSHRHTTERNGRSSSCFSYFEEHDSGLSSDCSVQKPIETVDMITSTDSGSVSFPGRNSFILKMLHENLRCYVITLAFLEKLLTDDETKIDRDDISMSEDIQESTSNLTYGIENALPDGIQSIDPNILSPYAIDGTTQSACRPSSSKVCYPCDAGHRAFLHGLQRKHQLETLPS